MQKITDTLILCSNSKGQPGGNSNIMSVSHSIIDIIEPMWSGSTYPNEMMLQGCSMRSRQQFLPGVFLSKYFVIIAYFIQTKSNVFFIRYDNLHPQTLYMNHISHILFYASI